MIAYLPIMVAGDIGLVDICAVGEGHQIWGQEEVEIVISLKTRQLDGCPHLRVIQRVGFIHEGNINGPEIGLQWTAPHGSVHAGDGVDIFAPQISRVRGFVLRAALIGDSTLNRP